MPLMTVDLIAKCTGQAKKKRDESQEQFLRRITHLYCSEKGIEAIENLSSCRNLSVLYLYDNCISHIDNMKSCISLTHLYLQNNNITRIANLSSLCWLSKLYLNSNTITVVEGLEELKQLSELHIAYQKLPVGEKLLFDPRSLHAIADSLTVMNVSGNNLNTISDLRCLTELTYFSACDNKLSSMKDISHAFSHWDNLTRLDLAGNPICLKFKYRDRVITMGKSIGLLDGREVSRTERLFLINWKAMRKARKLQQRQSMEQIPQYLSELLPSSSVALSANTILPPVPVPPPSLLPALPARQLPRKGKKQGYEGLPHITNVQKSSAIRSELKLPNLVPYQSAIAQPSSFMTPANNFSLPDKSWRTMDYISSNYGGREIIPHSTYT